MGDWALKRGPAASCAAEPEPWADPRRGLTGKLSQRLWREPDDVMMVALFARHAARYVLTSAKVYERESADAGAVIR